MDEKRQLIISVAIQLFTEKGFDATSVEEITKQCGISKGSFYNIFSSKEELLLEIFITIPNNIKVGLTKVYSKTYTSRQEKLKDFVAICFENILLHPTKLLLDSYFTLSVRKNRDDVLVKADDVMLEYNKWTSEFLLDLYGEKVEPYLADCLSLLTGMIFHNIHLFNRGKFNISSEKTSAHIAAVFDIAVTGMIEKQLEPLLTYKEIFKSGAVSPKTEAQRIQQLFEEILEKLNNEEECSEDYIEALKLLQQEYINKTSEPVKVKVLLHYLQSLPSISDECAELEKLLKEVVK